MLDVAPGKKKYNQGDTNPSSAHPDAARHSQATALRASVNGGEGSPDGLQVLRPAFPCPARVQQQLHIPKPQYVGKGSPARAIVAGVQPNLRHAGLPRVRAGRTCPPPGVLTRVHAGLHPPQSRSRNVNSQIKAWWPVALACNDAHVPASAAPSAGGSGLPGEVIQTGGLQAVLFALVCSCADRRPQAPGRPVRDVHAFSDHQTACCGRNDFAARATLLVLSGESLVYQSTFGAGA